MKPVAYAAPASIDEALAAIVDLPGAKFLGGGTNLVDLMREGIEKPDVLVDVTRLPLREITEASDGGLRIGAGVTNTDLATNLLVRQRYPALAQAVVMGASGQIRNMATVGGNLLQRTRCLYFSTMLPPATSAIPEVAAGRRRATTGWVPSSARASTASPCTLRTWPSRWSCSMRVSRSPTAPARGRSRSRTSTGCRGAPHLDTTLAPDELVTAVSIPPSPGRALPLPQGP